MSETTTSKANTPAKIENPEQVSSNFFWLYHTNAGAFNMQTTLRGILTPDQIHAHLKSLLELSAHIVEIGGLAKEAGKPAEGAVKVAESLPAASTTLSTEPQYIPDQVAPTSQQSSSEFVFDADQIACTITNGKQFFKVMGGPYKKYGVTVWPEVLTNAGIQPTNLEGGKTYKMPGWKAYYIKNDKDNPVKITRLEKVA